MPDLDTAIARLRRFRQSWNADDQICDDSELTAADLDVVIEAAAQATGLVGIQSIGFGQTPREKSPDPA